MLSIPQIVERLEVRPDRRDILIVDGRVNRPSRRPFDRVLSLEFPFDQRLREKLEGTTITGSLSDAEYVLYMSNKQRWKRAQSAERAHETHSTIPGDTAWAQRYLKAQFEVTLDSLRDQRVLEVGSGTGMIHSFPEEIDTIGIDPLSSELPLNGSSASVLTGVGEHLPISTGSVDVIICYNVLDHVLDPAKTVAEMYRVLREGGRLYLTVNVFRSPWLLRRIADQIDPPHPYHFSPEEVTNLVDDAGFEILIKRVQRHGLNPRKSVKAWFAKRVFRLYQIHIEATSSM